MTLKSFVSLTTAAALALMMAAGCTLPGGSSSLPSTKVMDFNAPLTLKKPAEPIKESPEVLFLGRRPGKLQLGLRHFAGPQHLSRH